MIFGISANFLKFSGKQIIQPLAFIFNESTNGIAPEQLNLAVRPTLKIVCVLYYLHCKKKSLRWSIKLFFTLFKLNITFYFKCYLHHNCRVNLNWNYIQLYSSAKPLCSVPSCILICKFLFSSISVQN